MPPMMRWAIRMLHDARVKKSLAVNFTISYIGRMDKVHALRQWRTVTGKTLADVASHVGVTPSHLSEIERDLSEPSLALAARLSAHTGIPIDRFVKRQETAA
jgi:DNA-binding XRE family transcriptional regulator